MNGFQNNFQSTQNGWQSNYIPQPSTNMSIVTSLEEALYKCNTRNSETVHFHQSLPEFYRIKVDNFGQKSWQTFNYMVPNQNADTPVTRADFDNLVQRIERLEAKEVMPNAEPNG